MKSTDIRDKDDQYENDVECENSIYIFPKRNCFRVGIYQMQKHRYFERVIITLIMLSTVKLIYDTYTLD